MLYIQKHGQIFLYGNKAIKDFSPATVAPLRRIVDDLFKDSDIWPTGKTMFYYGLSPPFRHLDIPLQGVARDKWYHNFGLSLHLAGVYLAGRIYGARNRRLFEVLHEND